MLDGSGAHRGSALGDGVLGRRAVLRGGLAMGAVGLFIGVGCSSEDDSAGGSDSRDASPPDGNLLDELASDGDVEVLDTTYSTTGAGAAPAFVLGTSGEEAVAYLCDPGGPHLWFAGTTDGSTLELTSPAGGQLTGTIEGEEVGVMLAGTSAYDGALTLTRSDAVSLVPQLDEAGARVGGLIVDGSVVTGSMRGTLESAGGAVTIGLRASTDEVADLFVVVSSDSGEFREREEPLRAALESVQPALEELHQRVFEAARGAEVAGECRTLVATVGALAAVTTTVALRQVDGTIVGEDVEGEALAARLGEELLPLVGDEGALSDFTARNDPTVDGAIATTMRQRLRAVGEAEVETPVGGVVDLAPA